MIENIDDRLIEELKKVNDENYFIRGVLNKLETYDDKERMYGFFYCGAKVTEKAIIILSTLIAKERQKRKL